MSKTVKYLVAGMEGSPVATLREVSDILGKKVTKSMIESGEVPEVEVVTEEIVEDETATDEGVARIYVGDDTYQEIPLINPLDHSNNTDGIEGEDIMKKNKKNVNLTEEDAMIEEIINGAEPEDTNEDGSTVSENTTPDAICADCQQVIPEGVLLHLLEDGTVLCDDCYKANESNDIEEDTNTDEDTTEEDDTDNEDNKPRDMASLLARMKELNAKKASEGTGTTKAKGKGGKVKKIEFTGEYPEVGTFSEKKQLQKFYKQLTDDQLNDWIELEGLTYKASDNEPINRMRKCMCILNLHFPPETKTATKKKSKYGDFTTEALLEMALENDLEVAEAKGDPRILRMYTIMALKKAGILE